MSVHLSIFIVLRSFSGTVSASPHSVAFVLQLSRALTGLAFISMVVLGFMIRNVDDSFHIIGASVAWFLSATEAAAQAFQRLTSFLEIGANVLFFICTSHVLLCLVPQIAS